MSLEPPTTATVTIKTSKGDINVALWAKEIPVALRSFLQNCLDKKYNNLSFNTITPDLVQIQSKHPEYGLRNEFHSRIRSARKGLLICARENTDTTHNHSVDEFFITLKELPQLHNQYIVLGKVTGESIYNVVKIGDSEVKEDGTPVYPATIKDVIVNDSFFDLVPSITTTETVIEEPVKKKQKRATKVKLDYDEDDDDTPHLHMKSSHDVKKPIQNPGPQIPDIANPDTHEKPSPSVKKIDATLESPPDVAEAKSVPDPKPEPVPGVEQPLKNQINPSPPSPPVNEIPPPQHRKKVRISRDPLLDSDYDANLDLSSDEDWNVEQFINHKSGVRKV